MDATKLKSTLSGTLRRSAISAKNFVIDKLETLKKPGKDDSVEIQRQLRMELQVVRQKLQVKRQLIEQTIALQKQTEAEIRSDYLKKLEALKKKRVDTQNQRDAVEEEYREAYTAYTEAKQQFDEQKEKALDVEAHINRLKQELIELDEHHDDLKRNYKKQLSTVTRESKYRLEALEQSVAKKESKVERFKSVLKNNDEPSTSFTNEEVTVEQDAVSEKRIKERTLGMFLVNCIDVPEIANEARIREHGYAVSGVKLASGYFSNVFEASSLSYSTYGDKLQCSIFELNRMNEAVREHLLLSGFKTALSLKGSSCISLLKTLDILMVTDTQKVFMFQEAVDETLKGKMINDPNRMNETQIQAISYCVCNAIAFLHGRGIAHGNVSVENVLFTHDERVVLGGLEFANAYWDSKNRSVFMAQKVAGQHAKHEAPEVNTGSNYDPTMADVYSFGVLICYMVLGNYPYDPQLSESSIAQWSESILQVKQQVSAPGYALLSKCLQLAPSDRIAASDALTDEWFH